MAVCKECVFENFRIGENKYDRIVIEYSPFGFPHILQNFESCGFIN